MKIFISGTDTDIGKTTICSWLCLKSGYSYYKPVQTGAAASKDSNVVVHLSQAKIYPESFIYQAPLSPHLAARLENQKIDLKQITLPPTKNLLVEGAGGALVPLNQSHLMVDLIKKLQLPVIIVTRSCLGTINHTLLTIEALKAREIKILGVIMNGKINNANKKAIEFYSKIMVLAQFPWLKRIDYNTLQNIPLPQKLAKILLKEKL